MQTIHFIHVYVRSNAFMNRVYSSSSVIKDLVTHHDRMWKRLWLKPSTKATKETCSPSSNQHLVSAENDMTTPSAKISSSLITTALSSVWSRITNLSSQRRTTELQNYAAINYRSVWKLGRDPETNLTDYFPKHSYKVALTIAVFTRDTFTRGKLTFLLYCITFCYSDVSCLQTLQL